MIFRLLLLGEAEKREACGCLFLVKQGQASP